MLQSLSVPPLSSGHPIKMVNHPTKCNSKRKRTMDWQFLDPDIVSGPKYCPEALSQYLQTKMRDDVKKHLFFLGWKIEFVNEKGVPRYRYTSAEGKKYLSLVKVCEDFKAKTDLIALQDQSLTRIESCVFDLEPVQESEVLDDDNGSYTRDQARSDSARVCSRDVDLKARYFPQAMVEWYMHGVDKNYKSTFKKSDLRAKAKEHLVGMGWTCYNLTKKNGKVELRYKSPTGKIFYSLRTACKFCMDESGLFESIASNSPVSGSIDSNSKRAACTDVSDEQLGGDSLMDMKNNQPEPQRSKNVLAKLKKLRDLTKCNTRSSRVLSGLHKTILSGPNIPEDSRNRNPRSVLSWLIDNNVVFPRDRVHYGSMAKNRSHGRITRSGIKCDCCFRVFSLRGFESHAGSKKNRPAANIFLEDGRTLLDCQKEMMKLMCNTKDPCENKVKNGNWVGNIENDIICSVCQYGGELILCDSCPSSFHRSCLGLQNVPDGEWFCPSCCCEICGFAKLKEDSDFLKCDQCELKHHINCLIKSGKNINIERIKYKGNWFCSEKCEHIYLGLHMLLGKQLNVGSENLTWSLLKAIDTHDSDPDTEADLITEIHSKLNVALDVIHECFEPVKESVTNRDLVEDVIFSRESKLKRLNFKGFYTVILERNDQVISVATVRVYGNKVAEVPLAGTRFQYRRLGMCSILMNQLETQLIELGVERLTLPAVPCVLKTWTGSFGFSVMKDCERVQFLNYTFLDFEDTIMCQKLLNIPDVDDYDVDISDWINVDYGSDHVEDC